VLHLDLAALVRLAEDPVRREVREDVAAVAGDDLADHASLEEQGAEARQAEHHEGEVAAGPLPPLAGPLTRRGRPPRVAGHDVDDVARPDVVANGVGERHHLVGHGAGAYARR
jgi:hypothetical protein